MQLLLALASYIDQIELDLVATPVLLQEHRQPLGVCGGQYGHQEGYRSYRRTGGVGRSGVQEASAGVDKGQRRDPNRRWNTMDVPRSKRINPTSTIFKGKQSAQILQKHFDGQPIIAM